MTPIILKFLYDNRFIILAVGVIATASLYIFDLHNKINNLQTVNTQLKVELALRDQTITALTEAITIQNKHIAKLNDNFISVQRELQVIIDEERFQLNKRNEQYTLLLTKYNNVKFNTCEEAIQYSLTNLIDNSWNRK